MAIITVTPIPQSFGDGTSPLFVTCEDPLYYGFGDVVPTTWHKYAPGPNSALNVSAEFGVMWFKAKETPSASVYISVGV